METIMNNENKKLSRKNKRRIARNIKTDGRTETLLKKIKKERKKKKIFY